MKSTHSQWTTSVSKLLPLLLSIVINVSQPVLSGVTWKMEPKNTTVRIGESVTLHCAVKTDGNDIHFPEWYKMTADGMDDDPITHSGTSFDDCCIVTGNRTNGEVNLHFESVRIEDEGTWICLSGRTVDDQTRYARLTVLDNAYPTLSSTEAQRKKQAIGSVLDSEIQFDILAKQGQIVTMHCKLDNYSHDTIHDWYREGQDGSLRHIASGSRSYYPEFYNITRPTEGQSELVIKAVNETDEGIWTCRSSLTPEREVVGMSARLVVLDDDLHCVKVSGVGPNGEVIIGSTVELQCSIGSRAMEYGNLVWTKNGIDTDKRSLNPLKFSKIVKVKDDGARFNCRLNHSTINYQWTCDDDIVFQVQSEPDPVVNIHFNVSENAVFVTWTPGFDGGHRQNFLIEFWETPDGNKQRTLYINLSMYTIEHLEQDTNYEIQIISVNELGNSSSDIFAFQTLAVFTADELIKQDYTIPVIVSVVVFVLVSMVTVIILFILKRKIFKRQSDYEEVKANDASVQSNDHQACREEIPMNEMDNYDDAATLDVFNGEQETPGVENTTADNASPSLCVSLVTPMLNTNCEYAVPDVIVEDPYMKFGEHVFEVNSNQTCLKEVIHSGKFYDVHKADAWFVAGQDGVTSVVIKTPKDVADKNSDASLRSEIETMKSIPPNGHLVKLLATCTKEGNPTYLIMEFANNGDLKEFLVCHLTRITSVTDHHKQLLSFAIDVAKGMKYLAEQKILHRCLSGKHVLVFHKQGIAKMIGKISNFGYASSVTNPGRYQDMERKPDYRWTASEVLMNEEFSLASEVWSYGILLWEIYTIGRVPYEAFTEHELIEEFIKGRRLVSPEKCPDNVFNLMLACWKSKPGSRPTMIDVVQDLDVIK